MARGTWQGSGTWQTSGPDLGPLAALAGIAVVVIGALEWLLARIWWLIGGTVLLVAVAAAAFVALSRWTERREARFAAQRRAQLAERAAAELPRPQRPAVEAAPQTVITGGTHIWLGNMPDAAQAAIIRKALPGTAGDATTDMK
jgi:hypothetical protein